MRKKRRKCYVMLYMAVILLLFLSFYSISLFRVTAGNERYIGQLSSKSSNCEEIHIALVCAGQESAMRTVTLLKSILYYRHNPLQFHFIVDDISKKILHNLFTTWKLPFVEVNFYNSTLVVDRISWIPNQHYSGVYGLMKITLTELLPTTLEKLLILDTDVLFMSDVAELWSMWYQMNRREAFGLVENLSGWYTSKNATKHMAWPALGRGFNTGVILMNLKKLRSIGWEKLWEEVAKKDLKKFGFTQLADQDIINAVISENPEMVYKLPCEWNFQMGFESQQHLCSICVSQIKSVHWNSPRKTLLQSRYAAFFKRYYKMFSDMDGNLFRTQNILCSEKTSSLNLRYVYEYDDDDDGCSEIRHARTVVYRSQLFVYPYSYQVQPDDITLVTQFSMDRFVFFELLLKFWQGPISAALYCTDLELSQLLQHISVSEAFANRTNVALHAVFKEGIHFPVNYLRNVALNASETAYVFLIDIDFLPTPELYKGVRTMLAQSKGLSKTALVIPAFEFKVDDTTLFPKTKNELLTMLDTGQIQTFRHDVWIQGHMATDYDKWRLAKQPYSVTWQTDYEPYIVANRTEIPPYDQRFVGFGWNKVSHIMLLETLGFNFMVLPDVYIIHRPHLPSFEIIKYRSSAVYRKCLKTLKGEFVRDLVRSKHQRVGH